LDIAEAGFLKAEGTNVGTLKVKVFSKKYLTTNYITEK